MSREVPQGVVKGEERLLGDVFVVGRHRETNEPVPGQIHRKGQYRWCSPASACYQTTNWPRIGRRRRRPKVPVGLLAKEKTLSPAVDMPLAPATIEKW
jgi:hypothetical protein